MVYYGGMDKKLEKLLDEINKKSGEQIAFVGERREIKSITTGVESLDFDIGCNGYPRGRITEIYGKEGAAKTSLALFGIAQAQKAGLRCLFIDAENTLDFELAESLGVDIDNLTILYPNYGEEGVQAIELLLQKNVVDFIVVDSIPSMRPIAELEADVNKPNFGGLAKMWSNAVYRLVPLLTKQGAVLILINQVRANMAGGGFDPHITPGGHAIKFHASLRIEVKKRATLSSGGETVGQQVIYKIKKTKMSKENPSGEMQYFYGDGFYGELDLLTMGVNSGIVTRAGNTYTLTETGDKLGVSKEKALDAIIADPELSQRIKDAS